jgi:cytoskeletal protein CcmA (bactofilin family)
MWRKDDAKPQGAEPSATPAVAPGVTPIASSFPAAKTNAPVAPSAPLASAARSGASISQGIKIKGELTGSEDLYVDGVVEGKLNLSNGTLTIGPNGSVKADVDAREVMVSGRIEGNITAREKVQLWSTGQVAGEVRTERLAIEEGASLRGKVEAGKSPAKSVAATAKGSSSSSSAAD